VKIAQIAPLYEAVPPRLYGGTERVVAHLCEALVALGHEVTLFAAADAVTPAKLVGVRDQALRLDGAPLKSEVAAHLNMLHEVRRYAAEFDILHFHLDMLHLPIFEQYARSSVTTLHGRLDVKDLESFYGRWSSFGLVSISNAQRRPLPDLNWIATVPHGVPPRLYPFQAKPEGGYLAFLGRIAPEKRPDLAIQLARRAGKPLKIAAKVDPVDRSYFDHKIYPMLQQAEVKYIGEIGDVEKAHFLGNASALLFPIDWPEPFGLVMIESMACGTPVIAWNCGSVKEIIEPGVNGFIVDSEAGALSAIDRVGQLDRTAVRASFERRFTATHMARTYLEVYARILNARPYTPRLRALQHSR
jgi:glycosyltransferase involved in cell wall biosynthesis